MVTLTRAIVTRRIARRARGPARDPARGARALRSSGVP